MLHGPLPATRFAGTRSPKPGEFASLTGARSSRRIMRAMRRSASLLYDNATVLHDEGRITKAGKVSQGVAVDGDDVGGEARAKRAAPAIDLEELGGAPGGRDDRLHRRQADERKLAHLLPGSSHSSPTAIRNASSPIAR